MTSCSKNEIDRIQKFLEDEVLLEVVRKVLFNEFDLNNFEIRKEDISNEILGQIARSVLGGKKLLEKGFEEIEKFRKVEESKKDINIAL